MCEEYQELAIKEMKRIYKKLGNSPNSSEYTANVNKKFSFAKLKKHGLTMNKVKALAKVPLNKPGFDKNSQKLAKDIQVTIFCESTQQQMKKKHCVPNYRIACRICKSIQKDNIAALSGVTEEEERDDRHNSGFGNKFGNGNDIYLTDIGII